MQSIGNGEFVRQQSGYQPMVIDKEDSQQRMYDQHEWFRDGNATGYPFDDYRGDDLIRSPYRSTYQPQPHTVYDGYLTPQQGGYPRPLQTNGPDGEYLGLPVGPLGSPIPRTNPPSAVSDSFDYDPEESFGEADTISLPGGFPHDDHQEPVDEGSLISQSMGSPYRDTYQPQPLTVYDGYLTPQQGGYPRPSQTSGPDREYLGLPVGPFGSTNPMTIPPPAVSDSFHYDPEDSFGVADTLSLPGGFTHDDLQEPFDEENLISQSTGSHYRDPNEPFGEDDFTPQLLGGYPHPSQAFEYNVPPPAGSSSTFPATIMAPQPRPSITGHGHAVGPSRLGGALGQYAYNPLGPRIPSTIHAASDSPALPLDRRRAQAYAKQITPIRTGSGYTALEAYQALFANYITKLAPTLGDGLDVRPSEIGIPKSGKGLFATQDYPRLSLITGVDGEVITYTEALARREAGEADYIRTLSNHMYAVDGLKADPPPRHRGLGLYANDSFRSPKMNFGLKNNAKFADVEVLDGTLKLCFLIAKEHIRAGDEILVSYGKKYWNVHDAQHEDDEEENASMSDGEESRSFTFY